MNPIDFALYHLRNRRLVCWLYPLTRADGHEFAPGTMFEILRQDGDRVNLCEIDMEWPGRPGATIVSVPSRGADLTGRIQT